MNRSQQLFLDILKEAIQDRPYEKNVSAYPWKDILELARIHKVLPLIFDEVCHLPDMLRLIQEDSYLQKLQIISAGAAAEQLIRHDQFLRLYEGLQDRGILPCIVKGMTVSRLYPKPCCRPSVDEDILVNETEFPACHEYMLGQGLTLLNPIQNLEDHETAYQSKNGYLYIEVHKTLFDPESRAYGQLTQAFKDVINRSIVEELPLYSEPDHKVKIATLHPTDHMLYLILHAYKHFLYSGFGIRQVCDINVFARAHQDMIDWDYINKTLNDNKALVFANALWKIGARWLGFEWQDPDPALDETLLLEDILEGGLYGTSTMTRLHSSNITLEAASDNLRHGTGSKGGFSYLFKSVFPPYDSLKNRYSFLRKMPLLLPVAWLLRIVSYTREIAKGEKGLSEVSESVKLGQKRIELLKKYGIIE